MEILKNKLSLGITILILLIFTVILILISTPINCNTDKTCWQVQLKNCANGASYFQSGLTTICEGFESSDDCGRFMTGYKIFPVDYNYKIIGRELFGQNVGLCKVEKYTTTALYSGSSTTGPEIEYYKDTNLVVFPKTNLLNCDYDKSCWDDKLIRCSVGWEYKNSDNHYDTSTWGLRVKNINHKIIGGIFSLCLVEEQIYEATRTKENPTIDSEIKFYSNYSLYNNSELVKFFN